MPTPPPTSIPDRRSSLIAGAMLLLLLGSLAAAYAMVRVRADTWATAVLSKAPQRIGDLRIATPRHWDRVARRDSAAHLSASATFEDPDEPGYRLSVGLLPSGSATTPAAALNAAINLLLDEDDRAHLRRVDLATVASAPMVGLRYTGLTREETTIRQHLLAAMTEDGRRYWLVHMTRSLPKSVVNERKLRDDGKLFEAMLGTMADAAFRQATADDFRAAGLPPDESPKGWPEHLAFRAQARGEIGAGVRIVPLDAVDRLRYLRLRAIPDIAFADVPPAAAPETLLTIEIVRLTGQAPAEGQVNAQPLGEVPLWRADLSVADPVGGEPTLTRQLWIARPAPGRCYVLELLAEPLAKARTIAAAERVVAALAQGSAPASDAPDSSGTTSTGPNAAPATASTTAPAGPVLAPPSDAGLAPDGSAVREALQRGGRLADMMRREMDKRAAPGWRYTLAEREGLHLGFLLARTSLLRGNDPMPLRGLSTAALPSLGSQSESEWAVSRDGQRFAIETLEGPGAERPQAPGWIRSGLELQSGRLTFTRGPAAGTRSLKMDQPVPLALLPPMSLHHWPEEFLHDPDSTPALVWIAWGSEAPAAYWIDRPRPRSQPAEAAAWALPAAPAARDPEPESDATPGAATAPAKEPKAPRSRLFPARAADLPHVALSIDREPDVSVRLLLWPMMGIEPTRLGFDLHGRLITAELRHQAGTPSDPNDITLTTVDRTTLLKRYPKLQAKLDEWDKKEPAP